MSWQPEQYLKFQKERARPFEDLAQLIRIRPGLKVVDLGCGTGSLTEKLADLLLESEILGIDNSEQMLEKARPRKRPGLEFQCRTIEQIEGQWDLIFSNAALHWLDDHPRLIRHLLSLLRPGGQLVFQTPSCRRNQAHKAINEIARREPFVKALKGWTWQFPVLEIEQYAQISFDCNCNNITAFDKVYPHILPDSKAVMEWVSGTTMIPYLKRLERELSEKFQEQCQKRFAEIWPTGPLLFPFRRILFACTRQRSENE